MKKKLPQITDEMRSRIAGGELVKNVLIHPRLPKLFMYVIYIDGYYDITLEHVNNPFSLN